LITPTTVILSVMPIYILLIGGAVLRKIGVLRKEHDEGIMHVIFSVMLPCFILDRTLGAEVLRDGAVLATGAGLGFGLIIVGISIGYLTGKVIGLAPGNGIRTFALTAGCQNFGFTAIPVVEILWGASAVAVLFVHNIGVEVAIWSVGVMLMSGERGIRWKRLVNGPIIAVVIGLLLLGLHLDDNITGPPRTAISMLGIGAFPLAIVMTGATIIDLVGTEKPSWKIISASVLVRIGIAPAIIILCAKFIPMAVELRQVLLVQAAMPAAMTPILLARLYGGRPAVAVQIVVATTVVSIFTLPYIITYGMRFLELTPLTP
jgi:malate permease and related proteins